MIANMIEIDSVNLPGKTSAVGSPCARASADNPHE